MLKETNRIIKILIFSYAVLAGAWSLSSPIYSIFILEGVNDNPSEAAKIVGFSYLVYWMVKSILQIPISNYLDNNHGEKDDFYFLILGVLITSLSPFGFAFSSAAWHIYLFQAVHAIGFAMIIPARSAIFTRHIDKGKEAYEWAMNSTCLGITSGITNAFGGIIAANYGFKTVFFLAGSFMMLSSLLMWLIKKDIFSTDKKVTRVSQFIEQNDFY
jgi:MFS family permease